MARALDGALDVVIEPGQGFGTGSHATTRLSLELLVELTPEGPIADWGCGSGILAIAAAKLGWGPVLACDIEPESVTETAESAQVNGVAVEVSRCDVRQGGPAAPTVLANLVRPLLLQVAEHMTEVPERMIISGLELPEVDEVAARLHPPQPDRARPPRGRRLGRDRAHQGAALNLKGLAPLSLPRDHV